MINKTINMYYQNVRGLRTKTHTFANNILSNDYDVISLTETWLNENFYNKELFPNTYKCFRKDRNDGRRGGGVLVAVHQKWSCVDLTDYNSPHEYVFLKLSNANFTFLLCCLYIPPNFPVEAYTAIYDLLESTSDLLNKNTLILGDFNLPEFNDCEINKIISNKKLVEMKIFTNFYNLINVNTIKNINLKILDLVWTNMDVDVTKDSVPLVVEDKYHPALNLTANINTDKQSNDDISGSNAYNFKRANFLKLYTDLAEVDWSFLSYYEDVNDAVEAFYKLLYSILDDNVPKVKKSKTTYPQWFTSEMISLCKQKCYHFKKIKLKHGDQQHHNLMYKDARQKLKELIKKGKTEFISDTEINICENPSAFWNYVRSKKATDNCTTFRSNDNQLLNKPKEIVESFANFFSSVYDNSKVSTTNNNKSKCLISNFSVTLEDVKESIRKLPPKKSCGPDLIPPYVVKGCADVLAVPLHILFNLSLTKKVFPKKWKVARVCPIFKSGDKRQVENYRPVSILSTPAKVFERVMYKYVYGQVASLITPYQHGFVASKSTVTNLIHITNYITRNMDLGNQTDVIYLDMSKAFDKILHSAIIKALEDCGLPDVVCEWFASYLEGRQQYVEYANYKSSNYFMNSGVPQGSNLGPLLFLLTINSVTEILDGCHCLLFADDIKLFRTISCLEDCKSLEIQLNKLNRWIQLQGLHFNAKKCKMISFSRRKDIINHPYSIEDVPVERVKVIRDLGVYFDSKLSFNYHIQHIVSQASKNLGFVLRTGYEFKNYRTYITLFNAFVRPKLEYASVIWSPYQQNHILCIEKIQTKFLRLLEFRISKVYPKFVSRVVLQTKFQVMSLEKRRNLHCLLLLYKIFDNTMTCPDILAEIGIKVPINGMRCRNVFFHVNIFLTNHSKMNPISKMAQLYNSLLSSNTEIDIFNINYHSFKTIINEILP